jgi:hypothetical protein
MAYDAFGNYTGGYGEDSQDPYTQLEEERKRREEEEQRRREAELTAANERPVAPVAPEVPANPTNQLPAEMKSSNWTNIPGQMFDQRVAQAQQRISDVGQMFVDPEAALRKRTDAAMGKSPEDTVANKQEVTTYADGSKTRKVTEEIPAEGPVAPQVATLPQPTARQAAQPVRAPIAPTQDQTAYNANIARQESGARPDIGFHDPSKGTAYGTYGITNAAYTDARRADPSLPSDIRQASPEQQTQAQNQVTANNARYLKGYGIEATPQNLGAAHFLGAKGLNDYLTTGYISPAAAAANGGEERVRQIVNGRLGGQPAPASGAVQPAAPAPVRPEQVAEQAAPSMYALGTGAGAPGLRMPPAPPMASAGTQAITAYQAAQDNPMELMKLRTDESQPEFIRKRAGERAYELMNRERQVNVANEKIDAMISSGDQNAIAKTMAAKPKTEEGSYLKAYLFARLGLNDLAKEEQIKLGAGDTWKPATTAGGETGLVKFNARGEPLQGTNADGTEMNAPTLAKFASGGAALKGVHQAGEVYKDPTGKVAGSFVLETRPGQAPVYKEVGSGRVATTAEGAVLNKTGVAGTLEQQAAAQSQKLALRQQYEPAIAAATKGASALAEFNAMNGTNFAIEGRDSQGRPLLVDQTTQQILRAPQVTGAPAARPQAAAAPMAPIAPTMAQPGIAAAPTGPVTPASIQEARKQQERLQEQGVTVSTDQQKRFNDYVEKDIQPKADAGKMISRVRKEQITGPDGILNNPELAGMMQGGQGSEVGNILRDLITGNFKDQSDLSTRVASLNLTPRQKDVLYTQIGLNNQILPQTLKANAGPGAISEAEHKINRDANVEITRQPLYSGLSLMTRDQFMKDVQVAKNDFRSANPGIRTTDDLNKAWNAQEKRAQSAYDGIYAARAAYIAKYNPNGTNPGAVVDAFKNYPVPEWTGNAWDYKTEYAKKAARPKLDSFNR